MKIRQITLNDDEDPESITVQMSVAEAALIAKTFGGFTGAEQAAMLRNGDEIGNEVYSALTGGFFNRFWEDGVNDVLDTMKPNS